MKHLVILIIILSLWDCRNSRHSDGFIIGDSKSKTTTSGIEKINYVECSEYLDFDSVIINENLRYENTLSDLKRYAGQPDSIEKIEDQLSNYNDSIYEIYHYSSFDFIVYNNKAFLDRVKFSNENIVVKFPKISFNRNTRLKDIEKVLPCTIAHKHDTLESKVGSLERIYVSVKPKLECNWNIFFKNDNLYEIAFFVPD